MGQEYIRDIHHITLHILEKVKMTCSPKMVGFYDGDSHPMVLSP